MIDKILKNGDSAEARLLVGTTKLLMNDATGAVTDLQKAVELDPTLPSADSYYGRALQKAGNPDEAEKAFRAELSSIPMISTPTCIWAPFSRKSMNIRRRCPFSGTP